MFRQFPIWYTQTPDYLNFYVPQYQAISYNPQQCYQRCMYKLAVTMSYVTDYVMEKYRCKRGD